MELAGDMLLANFFLLISFEFSKRWFTFVL